MYLHSTLFSSNVYCLIWFLPGFEASVDWVVEEEFSEIIGLKFDAGADEDRFVEFTVEVELEFNEAIDVSGLAAIASGCCGVDGFGREDGRETMTIVGPSWPYCGIIGNGIQFCQNHPLLLMSTCGLGTSMICGCDGMTCWFGIDWIGTVWGGAICPGLYWFKNPFGNNGARIAFWKFWNQVPIGVNGW